MNDIRQLRSWLFVPGGNQNFLDKSRRADCDCLIFDLEDGVVAEQKRAARDLVAVRLREPSARQRYFVRVNHRSSGWYEDDLAAVVVVGLSGVCLPKCASVEDVTDAARRLDGLEREHDLPRDSIRIVATIESAVGVLAAPQIAQAHPRVAGLMLGMEDLATDMGINSIRPGDTGRFLAARSMMALAAAAAGVAGIDGLFTDLTDQKGLAADIRVARGVGLTAKSAFSPRQLDTINLAFTDDMDEVARARTIVAAYESAVDRGEGAITVFGGLVDRPIADRARQVLAKADIRRAQEAG